MEAAAGEEVTPYPTCLRPFTRISLPLPKGKEGYVHLLHAPVIKLFIQTFHLILEARILVDMYLSVSICLRNYCFLHC